MPRLINNWGMIGGLLGDVLEGREELRVNMHPQPTRKPTSDSLCLDTNPFSVSHPNPFIPSAFSHISCLELSTRRTLNGPPALHALLLCPLPACPELFVNQLNGIVSIEGASLRQSSGIASPTRSPLAPLAPGLFPFCFSGPIQG